MTDVVEKVGDERFEAFCWRLWPRSPAVQHAGR
jgi:hypothetical protein